LIKFLKEVNFQKNFWKFMEDRKLKYGEEAILNAQLETWENPYPDRDYKIEITFLSSLASAQGRDILISQR
jgi:hypothetical protein